MSDDIVEQLRSRANQSAIRFGNMGYYSEADATLDKQAADEIERLRAALQPFAKDADCWDDVQVNSLPYSDLRRARRTVSPTCHPPGEEGSSPPDDDSA